MGKAAGATPTVPTTPKDWERRLSCPEPLQHKAGPNRHLIQAKPYQQFQSGPSFTLNWAGSLSSLRNHWTQAFFKIWVGLNTKEKAFSKRKLPLAEADIYHSNLITKIGQIPLERKFS